MNAKPKEPGEEAVPVKSPAAHLSEEDTDCLSRQRLRRKAASKRAHGRLGSRHPLSFLCKTDRRPRKRGVLVWLRGKRETLPGYHQLSAVGSSVLEY